MNITVYSTFGSPKRCTLELIRSLRLSQTIKIFLVKSRVTTLNIGILLKVQLKYNVLNKFIFIFKLNLNNFRNYYFSIQIF